MIDNVISELKGVSDNVDMEFENWFIFAVKFGEEVNIDHQLQDGLCLKAKRFSYYKRRLAIPFLDDVNSQREYRLKDRSHFSICYF